MSTSRLVRAKNQTLIKRSFSTITTLLWTGLFFVASMTPVLHYSMGGVEINNNSEVLDTNKKPIPGLYASGEVAGGVHGVNRLGGSSLLGCVVFGRVAADSASSYLLRSLATGSGPAARLGQIQNHLKTIVEVNPQNKNVQLTFSWDDSTGGTQFPGMTITYALMEALEDLAENDPNRDLHQKHLS
uniref:Fumarate reductase n=1 Tax=Phakopsora pachyrhizi TaxID=170000 RepID=A0A0S1MID9_PHAPC